MCIGLFSIVNGKLEFLFSEDADLAKMARALLKVCQDRGVIVEPKNVECKYIPDQCEPMVIL